MYACEARGMALCVSLLKLELLDHHGGDGRRCGRGTSGGLGVAAD